jgi:hypothetical protein
MQRTRSNVPAPPWGIPVNIPAPANAVVGQPATSWEHLRFSPLGAYHLRCWQGVFPGIRDFFISCQSRFRSADLAWFASGLNRDGDHNHAITSFHRSLVTLIGDTSSYAQGKNERKGLLLEVKELMFDIVSFFFPFSVQARMIIYIRQRCMIG